MLGCTSTRTNIEPCSDIGDEEEERKMHTENTAGCDTGYTDRSAVDVMLLDAEIRSVLENKDLTSEDKWIHYYLVIERLQYKRDPSFKPRQFKFEARPGDNGQTTYVLKRRGARWYQNKYFKFLPSLVGPVLGALCSVWFRSRDWCCI
jgi:hypothetical protein